MSEHLSPRVNSKRLAQFVNKTVRFPCKVVSFNGNNAIVQSSDGGQVTVMLTAGSDVRDTFVEFIGSVSDPSTIKMMACINMGDKLDLKLADDVVEMTFDPRFSHMFFD
ncbi:hypothetical protein AN958_02933 [Leucoagaricus sp. SymC.cos]|nr:hypothetical protein AN958_02933 [Leucoagaricus sp. SymC.cos]